MAMLIIDHGKKTSGHCSECLTPFNADPLSKTPVREQLTKQFADHKFQNQCNVLIRDNVVPPRNMKGVLAKEKRRPSPRRSGGRGR